MTTRSRRSFLSTATVAVAASLPGCSIVSPAAASICKAAPYIPAASPDAEIVTLCADFLRLDTEHAAAWEECNSLSSDDPKWVSYSLGADEQYETWAAAADACYAAVPRTPAGAAALMGVILHRDAAFIDAEPAKALDAVRLALLKMGAAR
jgi:hypothetical protein